MKKFTISTILILTSLSIYCQTSQYFEFVFTGDITNPSANFYDIRNHAENFYSNFPDPSEAGGYAQYKRWEWFWSTRVSGENSTIGSFQFSQQALASLLNEQVCTNNSFNSPWKAIGPERTMGSSSSAQNIGRIKAMAVDPSNNNIIYVGSEAAGVYKTSNGLSPSPTWVNITNSTNLPGLGINDIKIDPTNPQVIWIATGNPESGGYGIGILKSTDGGSTWDSKSPLPPNVGQIVKKVVINYLNPNIVYALVNDKLFKTYDGGASWVNVFTLPNSYGDVAYDPNLIARELYDIALHPTNPDIVYIASNDHAGAMSEWFSTSQNQFGGNDGLLMYKSTDGFNTYNLMNPANTPTSEVPGNRVTIAVTPAEPNSLFAIYKHDVNSQYANDNLVQFYKSPDMGNTWSLISNPSIGNGGGHKFNDLAVSPTEPNVIYTLGQGQPYKSVDGGLTFTGQFNSTMHVDARVMEIFGGSSIGSQGSNDFLIYGNDGGLQITTSGGNPWYDANGVGLNVVEYYGVGSSDFGYMIAGGTQDNDDSFYNGNTESWYLPTLSQDGADVLFDRSNSNIAYAQKWCCGAGSENIYKYEFTNGQWSNTGLNFKPAGDGPNVRAMTMDVNNFLYVGYKDVFKIHNSNINSSFVWSQISDFANNFANTSGDLQAVEVSESNPNVIYAAYPRQCWGCAVPSNEGILFKTTTGGGLNSGDWVNITGNLPLFVSHWLPPTDIVINPYNENELWITLGGYADYGISGTIYDGKYRVIHSTDAGQTWTDYSDGLTQFPVNDIKFHKGSNKGLYIATDVGVFYRNATMNQWECFSEDLPVCIFTDLSISPCQGKIWASTYGQGMWEADLVNDNYSNEITSNTIWNTDKNITTNVVVKSGATLTVNNGAVLNISKDKKIIIEKGGKLVINNATLTNECGQIWQGIEVWGDRYASQLTAGAQGILEIKNGAVIENARFAVRTSQTDANGQTVWDTFGGIVKVSNSTFKNNRSGIDFSPYQNFVPGNPSATLKDLSFVLNTTFTWEDNSNLVALGVQPYSHIGMWLNHGIVFSGNDFRNDASYTTYGGMNRGIGLVTFDAEYRVVSKCNSLTIPCSSYDDNNFVNLTYGIKASASNSFNTLVVKDANFVNCQRGILLKDIDYASLTKNNFDVASPVSPISNNYTYGIYLDNCNGYEVEENYATTSVLTPPNSIPTYGIYAFNSGQTDNEIYKNTCENVAVGIQSSNINGNGDQFNPQGLEFRCNDLNNLFNASLSITDILARPFQGNCATTISPANNSFDYTANYDIWTNPFLPFVGYRYSNDLGNIYGLQPRTPPNTNTNFFGQNCGTLLPNYNPNTSCPSHQPLPVTVLLANYSTFKTNATTTGSVIDGGNTANLLSIISSAPDYQVRNELINASPYLSSKVLTSMLNKTPALPDWVIDQVLTANAPLSDEVFIAMLERNPALPDYLIRNLALASSPLSTKEQLVLMNRTPALPTWIINQVMIENSPLFDEVLYALMDRFPTIPDWSIRNIFMQNTPLSEGVQYALKNHTPSYPNWVINGINNSPFVAGIPLEEPQPSSPLMEVSQEVAEFNRQATLTKNELFRTYLHDTTGTYGIADVIAFIKNEEGCGCTTKNHCDLTKAYIKQGDLINAQTKIDSLIQDTSLALFCELNSTIIDLKQSNTTLNTNAAAKQSTESIAQATTATKEKSAAEAMLAFEQFLIYQEVFEEIVPVNNSSRVASPNTVTLINENYNFNIVSVYPNPANENFTVSYNLNTNKDAIFKLYDIAGREVMRFKIINVVGEMKLSTQELNTGVYFYSVSMGDTYIMQDKLVITKH